jgi:hypothetical protein
MDFPLRTEIAISCPKWELDYRTPSVFIGSCFSDNIGGMLKRFKFPVLQNSFGVLYNPTTISKVLLLSILNQKIGKDELLFHENRWHSFYFHGSFSGANPDNVIERCNEAIATTHSFLKDANFLFVSLGTSWVYRHIESSIVVSNCHKIPANQFERYRLTVEEITREWVELLSALHTFNPGLKVVFTVSPIRHLKDGVHENQLSKSTLLLAIDEIIRQYGGEQIAYFPAYEIINDELRDYRFYASDMIHLSETAIDFIFEKFRSVYFTKLANDCYTEIKPIVLGKEHRILTDNREAIERFSQSMLEKIKKLNNSYPYINFKEEVEHFQTTRDLEKGFC